MTSATRLGELGAQIRAVLAHLPADADVTVRVRYGAGPDLAAASVWVASGGDLVRMGDLPAAVGLRMGLVEQALSQVGVSYPRTDLGLRARWRRITGPDEAMPGYELTVAPGAPAGAADAAPAESRSLRA